MSNNFLDSAHRQSNEFSVVQFFEDGSYKYINRFVSAENAIKIVKHLINFTPSPFRIIIADGGDCCCFEWLAGRGIVFPPKEEKQNE